MNLGGLPFITPLYRHVSFIKNDTTLVGFNFTTMKSNQYEVARLLEMNRELCVMVEKYERNLRNESSENLLESIRKDIETTRKHISKLYDSMFPNR